jgi:hypothetical protein
MTHSEAEMSTEAVTTRSYERPQRPAARSGAAARPAHPPVRLTRRGRLVIALCLVALFAAVSALTVRSSEAADRTGAPAYTWVTVGPGDTLWGLAAGAVPGDDPRKTVGRIIEMNRLNGGGVQAGQRLAVPVER